MSLLSFCFEWDDRLEMMAIVWRNSGRFGYSFRDWQPTLGMDGVP